MIGTSSSSLTTKVPYGGSLAGPSGSFTADASSLDSSTTYYYKAYMTVWNGSTYVDIASASVGQFTTSANPDYVPAGWLELPGTSGNADYVGSFYGSGGTTDDDRNYSYNYSYTYYASLWVAYPLNGAHKTGNASTSSWSYNPNFSSSYQVKVRSSDGSYPSMYGADSYSRGHQCPNADRKSDEQMNAQTYYVTNQTPQLDNKFNGSIWGALETAERNLVSTENDVVYVITGPAYRKVGGNETINYLTGVSGKNANPASLPIPNYYWKAFLKVKWKGSEVVSASAIGFWFVHKEYDSGDNYTNYAVSVDQIEAWTGFDLFTNLPGNNTSGIEKTAEANTNWQTFQNF